MVRRSAGFLFLLLRHGTAKWLLLGGIVGIICGLVAILFHSAVDTVFHFLVNGFCGYLPAGPAGEHHLFHATATPILRWWWLLLIVPAGGLISGVLTHFLASDARGAGTEAAVEADHQHDGTSSSAGGYCLDGLDTAVEAYHQHDGKIPLKDTLVKFVASVVTLGTCGSAGREGPIAMVGAGLASFLARRLHLSPRDRRILLSAGIAGGIAAIFRVPLAGAIFAAEVLYRDSELEADALIPCFISAIVGFCVYGLIAGVLFPLEGGVLLGPLFATVPMRFAVTDVKHLAGYLPLALVIIAVARWFIYLLLTGEKWFKWILVRPWLRPALGGALAAVIGLSCLGLAQVSGLLSLTDGVDPLATLGTGYGVIQHLLLDIDAVAGTGLTSVVAPTALLLLLVVVGKIFTTVCTVGSGGSGGIFGPSVVIGGCLGGLVGLVLKLLPWTHQLGIDPPVSACVIMGMAGFFAAGYKVPVAALIMVSELTGNYYLLLPAMWVCSLTFLFSGRATIVGSQLGSPLESPAHRGRFFHDILTGIAVADVFEREEGIPTLRPDATIDQCRRLVEESHQTVFPVVDAHGHLTGVFDAADLRAFLYDDTLGLVAVAQDVATTEVVTVTPEDSLAVALACFTEQNVDELPVVAADDGRFLGLLSRHLVIDHHNHLILELRRQESAEVVVPKDRDKTRRTSVGQPRD